MLNFLAGLVFCLGFHDEKQYILAGIYFSENQKSSVVHHSTEMEELIFKLPTSFSNSSKVGEHLLINRSERLGISSYNII